MTTYCKCQLHWEIKGFLYTCLKFKSQGNILPLAFLSFYLLSWLFLFLFFNFFSGYSGTLIKVICGGQDCFKAALKLSNSSKQTVLQNNGSLSKSKSIIMLDTLLIGQRNWIGWINQRHSKTSGTVTHTRLVRIWQVKIKSLPESRSNSDTSNTTVNHTEHRDYRIYEINSMFLDCYTFLTLESF